MTSWKRATSWKRRTEFQSKRFRPYALSVGQMNLTWNDFHEALGTLFLKLMVDHPRKLRDLRRCRVLWGAISSDREKRKLVEVLADNFDATRYPTVPTLTEDLKFLVRRGHSLEDRRNDVIHAPVFLVNNALVAGAMGVQCMDIVPSRFSARGQRLKGPAHRAGRELLAAIRLYRDYAAALSKYASDINDAWLARDTKRRRAWPRRPPLPPLKD